MPRMKASPNVLSTIGDVQRFAASCVRYANESSEYTFQVEFHSNMRRGGSPVFYTERNKNTVKIHVPNPTCATTERDALVIKAGILHEILHTTEGTIDADQLIRDSGIGELPQDDVLFKIWNILEDHRIERLDCEKFEGDKRVLTEAYRTLNEESIEYFKKEKDKIDLGEAGEKIMALRCTDLMSRDAWMNIGDIVEDWIEIQPGTVNNHVSTITDAGIDDKINKTETPEDVISLAKEIFELLFEKDPDQHCEENKQQSKGEEGEGEGEGEEQEGACESEEGDEDGEESEGKGKKKFKLTQKQIDYLDTLQNKMQMKDAGAGGSGNSIDYSRYFDSDTSGYEFDPCPMEDIGVVDYSTNTYKEPASKSLNLERNFGPGAKRGSFFEDISKVFQSNRTTVTSMANKIRRLLQVQSQARWVGGATKGRIRRKSAYRAAMPTIGTGRYNQEIFKKRHQDATLDVAVSVLCDFSGSMHGPKVEHATFGGFILGDSIGRVLRVPVKVTTFSEMGCRTVLTVLKNWGENVNEDKYIDRCERSLNSMNQNDDGSAILYTYNDLLTRPEKRKVMIVLSDGSPASSRSGDAMGYCIRVVKDIEADKKVDIYGIGIEDDNVAHIYSEYSVINDSSEIEEAILTTVKRRLIV